MNFLLTDLDEIKAENSELTLDHFNKHPRTLEELFIVLDSIPGQQRLATGSRVICNPPVLDTDEDWFIYVPEREDVDYLLIESGFTPIEGARTYSDFTSFRKGIWNLSVTDDAELFTRSCLATELAKRFNLLQKQDRVDLFNAIQFGVLK